MSEPSRHVTSVEACCGCTDFCQYHLIKTPRSHWSRYSDPYLTEEKSEADRQKHRKYQEKASSNFSIAGN